MAKRVADTQMTKEGMDEFDRRQQDPNKREMDHSRDTADEPPQRATAAQMANRK